MQVKLSLGQCLPRVAGQCRKVIGIRTAHTTAIAVPYAAQFGAQARPSELSGEVDADHVVAPESASRYEEVLAACNVVPLQRLTVSTGKAASPHISRSSNTYQNYMVFDTVQHHASELPVLCRL